MCLIKIIMFNKNYYVNQNIYVFNQNIIIKVGFNRLYTF